MEKKEAILSAKCQCNYVRYVIDAPYMPRSHLKQCEMTTAGLINFIKERETGSKSNKAALQ